MFFFDPLSLGIVATLGLLLLPVAFFVVVIFGWPYLLWRLRRRLTRQTDLTDSKGRDIPKAGLARFGLSTLPLDMALAGRVGMKQAPEVSLGAITMRPTIGLRLISGVLSLICVAIFLSDPEHFGLSDTLLTIGAALLVYGFVFTNASYVRYDAEGLSAPGAAFQTKTARWADVVSLSDHGHYLYVIRTRDGQKIEIQKFLTGIEDFLTYAADQIAYHQEQALDAKVPPVGAVW